MNLPTGNGVRFTPGFVLHTVLVITAIAGAFVALKSDMAVAAQRIEEHQRAIDENSKQLMQLQLDITKIKDDVGYLRGKH